MYQALYRKYRPQNFDSVVGQNSIIKTLRNSIKNRTFSHAYIFFGPRGTGKTTISKIFAKNINCLDPKDGISCGKCKNCLISNEKECVDIIEIDAASNNSVDEIRELRNKISLVPAELKYKVYIIDEVHMLSIGAFNALLKTLEEPPSHAVFILATTDPQKVPETIISRCQCFSFKRISEDMIVERLKFVCESENILIDDDVLTEIAFTSDGGMRDALSMLDKLSSYSDDKISSDDFSELNGTITNKELYSLCSSIFKFDIPEVLNKLDFYNKNGKNLVQIMTKLMYFLRNIVVDFYISNKECDFSIDLIQDLIININENMFDIKKSGNPKLYIEMFLIKFMRKMSKNDVRNVDIKENIDNTVVEKITELNNLENNNKNNEDIVEKQDDSKITNSFDNVDNDKDDEVIDDFVSNDGSDEFVDSSVPRVLNINEIIDVRINNTLASASKDLLKIELQNFNLLNDYTFDQEIGYIVCNLLDGKIRAVSSDSLIISYDYDSSVKQNLIDLEKIMHVYNKITNSNKKIAFITDDRWEIERSNYIKSIKNGLQYKILEEPDAILEELNNDDIIVSSAVKLFGDIVEID